jgi:valyl-tRNA synthetase
VLVTGYDILFFWVARMMMFGTFVAEDPVLTAGKDDVAQVPFKDVFLHGLIRDQFGKKMSKSRGNGIDPLDWIRSYGADALRFTLARGAQPGGDLSVGEPHALASRSFVTKLFNATKFALMNGAHTGDLPARAELTDADRWIIDRLEEVRAEVDSAFDAYEFGKACEALYHFAWDELCDWYLELAKVQFAAEGSRAESTAVVLGNVLDAVLRLLHPVIPFVTESLWQALTGGESVVIATWPQATGVPTDATSARRISDAQRLITEIRRFRSDQGLADKQKVAAKLIGLDPADLTDQRASVANLARLTEPGDEFTATASLEIRLSAATVTVELDTSGSVDLDAERRRLEKDLAAAEKEFAATTTKLGNEAFLAKAPEPVVDKIKGRRDVAESEVIRISARLTELSAK